jgi:nicotinamidase-related amidase
MENPHAKDALRELAKKPVVVTIDLHRGHLDPAVATLPLPADASAALIERTVPLLHQYRDLGIPVIHVITSYRNREEILSNRYWRFQSGLTGSSRRAIAEHNLDHLPGLELMPGIWDDRDQLVTTKKRYDCLLGTDLELMLRAHGYDSLLVLGVNTNSCVIATTASASVRDWAVFVVEEGVDTMLGAELHEAAAAVINASFGWMVNAATTLEVLREPASV